MSNFYVYQIRSRNKDNKDVPNFKERTKTILEYKENEENMIGKMNLTVEKSAVLFLQFWKRGE